MITYTKDPIRNIVYHEIRNSPTSDLMSKLVSRSYEWCLQIFETKFSEAASLCNIKPSYQIQPDLSIFQEFALMYPAARSTWTWLMQSVHSYRLPTSSHALLISSQSNFLIKLRTWPHLELVLLPSKVVTQIPLTHIANKPSVLFKFILQLLCRIVWLFNKNIFC